MIIIIDSSGSMTLKSQIGVVKSIIQNTLKKLKQDTTFISIIILKEGTAEILFRESKLKEVDLEQMEMIKTGGKTNLIEGLKIASHIQNENKFKKRQMFIFTDGKINKGLGGLPMAEAIDYFTSIFSGKDTTVIDTEEGFIRSRQAEALAHGFNCHYISIRALQQNISI